MDEILKKELSVMANMKFECSCGHKHSVGIDRICTGENVWHVVADIIQEKRFRNVLLVADRNTFSIVGKKAEALLLEDHVTVKTVILKRKQEVTADEKSVGRVLIELEHDTEAILAVGSGTIGDICRIVGSRAKIPYIVMATAPSTDGYASTVSSLIIEGYRVTYPAAAPLAVVADYNVLKGAPYDMICAGFGELLSKYTALADWKLSHIINQEYFCETTDHMIRAAADQCMEHIEGARKRSAKAIGSIAEGLILSGIAVNLTGNLRPAAGAEHYLVNYWETDFMADGKNPPLSGNMAGVAAIASAWMYEKTGAKEKYHLEVFRPEDMIRLLDAMGAAANPEELDISKELFYQSICHSFDECPQYTIFQYAKSTGKIEEYAAGLTEMFYGEG